MFTAFARVVAPSTRWLVAAALPLLLSCGPDQELAAPELLEAPPAVHWTASAAGATFRFSPDGNTVVTAGVGETAKLLSAADGSVIRTLPIEGSVASAAFSRDGALLAIGSAGFNQNLRLFRLADGALLFQKTAHNNGTTAVNFSPTDPTLFATAGRDRTTKIWKTDGTLVRTMSDGIRVLGMSYSPGGQTVASNASGRVHIWRVADGVLVRTITATNQTAIAYSPDGTLLSTGTQLWNAATGALVRTLAWPSGSPVATTFTRNGAAIISGGEDFPNMVDVATIRYFRVSDGGILTTFDQIGGSHAYVNSVAISPDGTSLGYTVATDLTTVLATSPF
jgi:WD40 repeat protein